MGYAFSVTLFGYGCSATTYPSVIRELYGTKHFSSNYSILTSDSIISSLFPTAVGIMQRSTGNYQLPLFLIVGVTIINLLVVVLFNKNNKQ